jgi:rhamnulokinase
VGEVFAAVDLGAASGRVITGSVGHSGHSGLSGLKGLELREVRRFPNRPVRAGGTLYWDILGLYGHVLDGLRSAGPGLISIGVDSWAVDYGLLDPAGRLLGNPVHYRDSRTDGVMERVRAELGDEYLYGVTGLQFLPFNTIYQLCSTDLGRAARLLLIPDLLAYWLTGEQSTEVTNASTTGLLDVRQRDWSVALLERLGLPGHLFPDVRSAGDPIGTLLPDVATETGVAAATPVVAVATHDTASAVAAVPAAPGSRFAYISCGTWSLVGVELPAPVLSAAGLAANFTNEAGIDGTVRYLRNVMGLWLLQESLRTWGEPELGPLLDAAADLPGLRCVVDAAATEFLAPGDMPARIAAWCRRTGQPPPDGPAATVRCILDSLALAHRQAVHDAAALSGQPVDTVHLVGGGSRNPLLCQLTADACGLPVVAGPAEATAIGNILVQARAAGVVADLAAMRALVASSQPLRRYDPDGDEPAWAHAAQRL